MGFNHGDHKKDFTILDNTALRDRNLSLGAKGMMALASGLPLNWHFNITGLVTLSANGRTAVTSILKELEEHGYLTMTTLRDERGRMCGTDITFYEKPHTEQPQTENPHTEHPHTAHPKAEVRQLVRKQGSSTNKRNTNLIKKEGERTEGIAISSLPMPPELEGFAPEVREAFQELMRVRVKRNAPVTPKVIKLILSHIVEYAGSEPANQLSLINVSIEHGWKTVYPPKQPSAYRAAGSAPGKASAETFAEQTMEIIRQKGLIQ